MRTPRLVLLALLLVAPLVAGPRIILRIPPPPILEFGFGQEHGHRYDRGSRHREMQYLRWLEEERRRQRHFRHGHGDRDRRFDRDREWRQERDRDWRQDDDRRDRRPFDR